MTKERRYPPLHGSRDLTVFSRRESEFFSYKSHREKIDHVQLLFFLEVVELFSTVESEDYQVFDMHLLKWSCMKFFSRQNVTSTKHITENFKATTSVTTSYDKVCNTTTLKFSVLASCHIHAGWWFSIPLPAQVFLAWRTVRSLIPQVAGCFLTSAVRGRDNLAIRPGPDGLSSKSRVLTALFSGNTTNDCKTLCAITAPTSTLAKLNR